MSIGLGEVKVRTTMSSQLHHWASSAYFHVGVGLDCISADFTMNIWMAGKTVVIKYGHIHLA